MELAIFGDQKKTVSDPLGVGGGGYAGVGIARATGLSDLLDFLIYSTFWFTRLTYLLNILIY